MREDSDLMIVSQNGKIIRIESSTIRQAGRSTQGVRLVSHGRGRQGGGGSRASRRPEKRQRRNGRRCRFSKPDRCDSRMAAYSWICRTRRDCVRRKSKLFADLGAMGRVIVAFSGGTDSAYLAWAANRALGANAVAITADSASLPESHKRDAEAFVRQFGIPARVHRRRTSSTIRIT